MKDLKIILAAITVMISMYAQRAYSQELPLSLDFTDKSRLFEIKGTITSQVGPLVNRMGNIQEGEMNILIDSPGGSVVGMLKIHSTIALAKKRGVVVNCLVTGMAASAAFWTLNECTNRYAMEMSMLMFHEGAMYGRGGKVIPRSLTYLNNYQRDRQIRTMGMDPLIYEKAYKDSYIWMTRELMSKVNVGYIDIIDAIKLPKDVKLFYQASPKPNLFDILKPLITPKRKEGK